MDLKRNSLEELKTIIKKDYGVELNDENANRLGSSLLKLSRLSINILNKSKEDELTENNLLT
jgi:hypothetical protein